MSKYNAKNFTDEEIDARIAKSREKYLALRQVQKIEKELRKNALEFYKEKGIKLGGFTINGYLVTYGFTRTWLNYSKEQVEASYCIKSPIDEDCIKRAKILVSNRLYLSPYGNPANYKGTILDCGVFDRYNTDDEVNKEVSEKVWVNLLQNNPCRNLEKSLGFHTVQ